MISVLPIWYLIGYTGSWAKHLVQIPKRTKNEKASTFVEAFCDPAGTQRILTFKP